MKNVTKNILPIVAFAAIEIPTIYLLTLNIIPRHLRFYFLIAFALLVVVYSIFSKVTLYDLGFRKDNLKQAIILNILLVVGVSALIILAKEFNLVRTLDYENTIPISWYFLYGLVFAPVQEFVFRGFLFSQLNKAGVANPVIKILLTGILFGIIHLIYGDNLTLIFGIMMGIIWSWSYYLRPNIYGVMLSHCIIGALAIYLRVI